MGAALASKKEPVINLVMDHLQPPPPPSIVVDSPKSWEDELTSKLSLVNITRYKIHQSPINKIPLGTIHMLRFTIL